MSFNSNDLVALTPGHFLIGEPLKAQMDVRAAPFKANLLTRWKLVTHLKHEPEPGIMVVIKEDNNPVLQKPLARIIRTYMGDDGAVRVIGVQTTTEVWK